MKFRPFILPVVLVLATFAAQPAARADDKKKLLEWQLQQQQLQDQWKFQEVQRQQQLLRQQQANQRSRALAPGSPWGVNQNGRGALTFSGGTPDRLNFVVVTLNNFYDARGNASHAGSATVTLYGGYSYPLRGTWSMQGNFTIGLNLTPAANAVRGDRAIGNLTMAPPNGARVSRITLTGVMSGNPFTANFASQ